MENVDQKTVQGFGAEWARFDQRSLSDDELQRYFDAYFSIFPWEALPPNAVGLDVGCGSGRWAARVAPRVGKLHCVDASAEALAVAQQNLSSRGNVEFHLASVQAMPLPDESLDFAYSLGVLHHVPDTAAALKASVAKVKRGAPFLVYLYYRFDNRPAWYQSLWRLSDSGRRIISHLPRPLKHAVADVVAVGVYLPLAKTAKLLERAQRDVSGFPLSTYRDASFYTMRTDALDRFGTRLEQRFTRKEIRSMMSAAGLERIQFSDSPPFWCALGFKR